MLVIFDWDGTLIDSKAKIVGSMQQAAASLKLPALADQDIANIIGLALYEAIALLYPSISDADNKRLQKAYSQVFVEKDQNPCAFFPTVEQSLEQLKNQGHQIAVATGKSRRGLDRVLSTVGWQQYFDDTRCADETASKPHPKMLHELLDALNADAQSAIMVGDSEYDLLMAKNAQVKSLGVSYGVHPPERLQKHQPEAIIDRLSEVVDYVTRNTYG